MAEFKTYQELDAAVVAAANYLADLKAIPCAWRPAKDSDVLGLPSNKGVYVCDRCGSWSADMRHWKNVPCWRESRGG